MRPTEYDIRVISAVRALRELRQLKLFCLASELGMTASNYCKFENGHKAFSMGQLKTIARALNVSVFLILALADAEYMRDEKIEPLSDILLEFIRKTQEAGGALSDQEVGLVLTKIAMSSPVKPR